MASGCGSPYIAMHFVLADSGCATPFLSTCRCRVWEQCCGGSGSHRLLFLEEDCDTMLENVDACVLGMAAVLGDVVESTNYILKKGYSGHSSRGGDAGKSAVEREAIVDQHVWEWWFVTFDLQFLHYNTPHTAACTAASILSTTPQTPSIQAPSCPSALFLFAHPWMLPN